MASNEEFGELKMQLYLASYKSMRPLLAGLEIRPKYILESFVYMEERYIDELDLESFLLDSGAFTFLSNQTANIDWTAYVRKYADFIKRRQIQNYFELDIYKIIGKQRTEELRDMLQQMTGIACIPVWHRHLGREYLEQLASNFSYIAFGGFAIGDIRPSEYRFIPELLKICERYKCRVHGLGFTSQPWLKKCPFFSIDSSTWVSGQRFGRLFEFKNGELKGYSPPKGFRATRRTWTETLKAWIEFAQYAEEYL